MLLSHPDHERLKLHCTRSAMVLIAWELERLMSSAANRSFCSAATIRLVQQTMEDLKELRITRKVVRDASRIANLASAMSWLKEESAEA